MHPEVTLFAYLAKYPVVILGSLGCHLLLRSAKTSSDTRTFIVFLGISISIISPSSIKAIFPPTAASGETCPIAAPLVAPENLPSVISATEFPKPLPIIAEVGFSISLIPGPPFGPS